MNPTAPSLPAPRLLAILAADAAGYTRLMAIDDRLTIELLDAARAVFRSSCEEHTGRVVDMAGDSVLLAFDSAASALRCALAVQQRLVAQASVDTGTLRLPFRIGLHLGDVIEKADGSVYGDGVNIAARLQSLAEPDEVFVSQAVRDLLGARPVARFEDAGEHQLKNVAHPVRAWRAWPPGSAARAAERPASASTAPAEGRLFGGRFALQPRERRLLVDGKPAALGSRAFDLLLALAEQPGALVTKNQLLERVWPGLVVEEGNLATQISTLRKVLGGDVIATIPGRGYRFTARVDAASASSPAPGPQATAPAPTSPPQAARLQSNLPATLPHLVGRADDLAALHELVNQHRLVSIIGAGGMGKTTVALHLTAGRQAGYLHGVCWVELANVTDPEALPGAIASALGVRIGSGEPLAGLVEALRPLEVLVALDNAEQVVQGVAQVVQAVLDKAAGVRFLVTSQALLKLAAERAYRIGALAVPQGPLPADQARDFGAVALFVERAQAADARFALTDGNAPAVIDLCRQLDGLALAIELAAARAPLLGVQRLASSMGDRLKVLTSSRNRAAPARQQTLRAALEWSHGFLEPAELAVFRRLSVFAGSASLTLVQQVVADPPGEREGEGDLDEWAVLDTLAVLVDRSLVVAITPDDAAEPRYRLLDTPRLFAREKLQQAGEEAALRQRHAHAVAALFEAADVERDAGRVGLDAWREALEADLDNGRAALAWAREAGDAERLVQIAALLISLQVGRDGRESIELFAVLEPFLETVSNPMVASGLCALVYVTLGRSQPARALPLVRRLAAKTMALAGTDTEAARWWRHRALAVLSRAEARAGNQPEAETALEAARALHYPAWPPIRHLAYLDAEAWLARLRGDAQADLQCTRHVLQLQRAAGSLQSIALANLVDAELAAGNVAAAARTGREALALLAGSRNLGNLVVVRMNLAAALLALGDAAQARPQLSAGWAQAPLFELQPSLADYLALLAALEGRLEAAARLAGYADAANALVGPREPNEAAAIARATQLVRAALGDVDSDGEFDRLHAEGALLREADIAALAFPIEPSA